MRVIETEEFGQWIKRLKDRMAKFMIAKRLQRIRDSGHLGDVAPVGQGVSELRIHYGPGYRIYLLQHGDVLVVLLHGGDKDSQTTDIKRAIELAQAWREGQ
ncbi:type II toxin-antitoxin system RelE/ParE family toxin [Brevundimonas naejangsanensis]|uniref:type II toxin-antitoxin system RelE/ParE family toxin n=1 Tax=Brevundimonas naejangsanensis TaxID=588932 RepID=UPI000EC4BBBC|nr:type II toxin-antitoxin system RelE/ParE family toxin [Brevundimonas naejangsanensis]HAC02072.1 addiction module antitoxin RelB [Brevundimonas sp.]